MQLSKHNNGEVLDSMIAISELTGIGFEKVCRTGISRWWASIFDDMVSGDECEAIAVSFNGGEQDQTELVYTGGTALQPKKGFVS
jgi:hypothetical protein